MKCVKTDGRNTWYLGSASCNDLTHDVTVFNCTINKFHKIRILFSKNSRFIRKAKIKKLEYYSNELESSITIREKVLCLCSLSGYLFTLYFRNCLVFYVLFSYRTTIIF